MFVTPGASTRLFHFHTLIRYAVVALQAVISLPNGYLVHGQFI